MRGRRALSSALSFFWVIEMAKRKLPAIDYNKVEELASKGLTQAQIATSLGISVRTLYTKKKTEKLFAEALERGQTRGIVEVTNRLFEQAMEGNTTAIIFYLKARAGWAEKMNVSVGGNGEPIKHEVTTDELKALPYEKLIKLAELADGESN